MSSVPVTPRRSILGTAWGAALSNLNRFDEVERLLEGFFEFDPNESFFTREEVLSRMATNEYNQGRVERAIEILEDVYPRATGQHRLMVGKSLAGMLLSAGRPERALALADEVLGEARAFKAEDITGYAKEAAFKASQVKAAILIQMQRIEEAIGLLKELLPRAIEVYTSQHDFVDETRWHLVQAYVRLHRNAEAYVVQQRRVDVQRERGDESPRLFADLMYLGQLAHVLQDYGPAVESLRSALPYFVAQRPASSDRHTCQSPARDLCVLPPIGSSKRPRQRPLASRPCPKPRAIQPGSRSGSATTTLVAWRCRGSAVLTKRTHTCTPCSKDGRDRRRARRTPMLPSYG